VAPRNRNSGKRKTQRHGLSGNPQRRAEQLGRERAPRPADSDLEEPDLPSESQVEALRNLVYRLAGGTEEAPWWRDSHERVLGQARELAWPAGLRGIEDQTCDLVGGQFYDNLQTHDGGHHQAQWLRALAEHAGAALRAAIADGGDWRPLWTLLYGMVLTAPEPPAQDEHDIALREEFPDIRDPYEAAVAELEKATALLSSPQRALVSPVTFPVSGPRPAGVPLIARDAYGSRFLVAAPFGYEADVPDHWYAWDVDTCWVLSVVAAGTFGSAEEALAEWRAAVGTAAGSELSPADPVLLSKLLGPCLLTGPFSEMLTGNEPRELIRELYRMRRRARALAAASGTAEEAPASEAQPDQASGAPKEFRAWYRTRHPGAPKGIAATAESIIEAWGPGSPIDEREFYACSPFRVAMTAHLIGDGYEPALASRAIRLLPEWTQWCAEQSGLPGRLTAPSIAAARAAADALDKQDADEQPDPTETTPFRHQE
jgi:hypothetical protein